MHRLLVLAAIFILAGCATTDIHAASTAAPQGITLATFGELQDGMTVAQADSILGGPGVVTVSVGAGTPYSTVSYQWGSPTSAYVVTVGFQNGKLVDRSEFGLG